jgi:hypothetical protein
VAVVVQAVRRRRRVLVGAAVLVAVLALVVAALAVVQRGSGTGTEGASEVRAVAPALPAPMIGKGEAAQDGGGAATAAPDQRAGDGQGPGVPVGGVQRALVRTAQLTVEVDDPASAARQVRTIAAGAGGFVTEEQSGDTGSWLVLRVPVAALDRLIDEVGAFGQVAERSSQVIDATEELVDLDARVASQSASVARVRGLLAEAETIGDVVAIESELARREADLDSLTRRLEAMRDQVALSTLTVDLRGPGTAPPAQPAPGFLGGLAAGWEGLRAVGSAAAAVLGFVLPFLPVLAALGGIFWLVRRITRTERRPAAAAVGRSGPGSEGES